MLGRARRDLPRRLVGGAELLPVPEGLLEVVSEDLLVLGHPFARGLRQPAREALVQIGPLLLRHRLVRSITDQQMPEPERVLASELRPVRPDQLLAGQCQQPGPNVRARRLLAERRDGPGMEHLALDRSALDHRALVGVEPVQARGQEQVDRRRHGDVRQILDRSPRTALESEEAVVDQHREHLLDEERVALGGLEDPVTRDLRDVGSPEEVVDELRRIVAGQRLKQDRGRVHLAAAPTGADLEELGPRDAQHQDRGIPRPVREVFDQVEERRLSPVDIVEHDH